MALFEHTPSARTRALLQWEVANINRYLASYGSPGAKAVLDNSYQFIRVLGFRLPRGYAPASADMVIIVADFPGSPPYGLYLLNSDRAQVKKIKSLFGFFHVTGVSWATPEAIPGYTWICYHYAGSRWSYRAEAPALGDNLAKFLRSFAVELDVGARR